MSLFARFRKKKQPLMSKQAEQEPYWLLCTDERDCREPVWEQIQSAVREAGDGYATFVPLSYVYTDKAIETLQTIVDNQCYRIEALAPVHAAEHGQRFVINDLSEEKTLSLFNEFFSTNNLPVFTAGQLKNCENPIRALT
ncbi:hypothetical protein ACFO4L_11865 [Bacillus daqingensis]|uniref:Uncharacterized protein n=1 Tax=Bacillus daqingensis TaxID=872396 RepID=A0ABV9NYT2_9BACI